MDKSTILKRVHVRELLQDLLEAVDELSWELDPTDYQFMLRVLYDFAYERLDEKPTHMKSGVEPMDEIESNAFESTKIGNKLVGEISINNLEKIADKPDCFKDSLRRYLAGSKARSRHSKELHQ